MGGLLTSFELHLVYLAVGVLLGAGFGPRVKDWVTGVPSNLRAALKSSEAYAKARLKDEAAKIVAELHSAVVKATPVPVQVPSVRPTVVVPPIVPVQVPPTV